MQQLIELLTKQYNLNEDEAARIINTIANYAEQVTSKVPKISLLIDELFEEIDEDQLQQDINRTTYFIQHHKKHKYKSRSLLL